MHPFRIKHRRGDQQGEFWEWDGDKESPTYSPSLLVYGSVHMCKEDHKEECKDYQHCDQSGHAVIEDKYYHIGPHTSDPPRGNCHSFVRDGKWEFLNDCDHEFRGKTVPLADIPLWWLGDDG